MTTLSTYYVGLKYVGKDREVHVVVRGCRAEAETEKLERIRAIEADSKDEAARKYAELVTGGRAAVRRPN